MADPYREQVILLLRILPSIARELVFGLKGGTAINLFERNLPRLSVDIDLTYLPFDDRETALANIAAALTRIKGNIEKSVPGISVTVVAQSDGTEAKLHCQLLRTQIKIEVNTTMRGHVFAPRALDCAQKVQDEFGAFLEMQVVSAGELYGGKLCAALDRQHPRDLFDVKLLLDGEGITEEIRQGFLAALLSHPRPIAEVLSPKLKDQRHAFDGQFAGMAFLPFTYEDYETTRQSLVALLNAAITSDEKALLLSFKAGEPDWKLSHIAELERLPAVQFKLANIRKLKAANPVKHAAAFEILRAHLQSGDPEHGG
jgi:predicted nucleotidyltransferase component of viral defense system